MPIKQDSQTRVCPLLATVGEESPRYCSLAGRYGLNQRSDYQTT